MAIVVASGQTESVGAYTKTANLITGRNQFLGKGRIVVVWYPSAVGMNMSLSIGGVPLIDDEVSPWFGTTGSMNAKEHVIVDQIIAGGTAELYLRNTTVGALTNDYVVYFTPM
tara:strand:- start:100 stop:438 length:339 start_codon:yes stop_codon:yes gene_type:complete